MIFLQGLSKYPERGQIVVAMHESARTASLSLNGEIVIFMEANST
jgi:hypothetical protein